MIDMVWQYKHMISTINEVENVYMKNCQPEWIDHWIKVRARLFAELIAFQIKFYRRG